MGAILPSCCGGGFGGVLFVLFLVLHVVVGLLVFVSLFGLSLSLCVASGWFGVVVVCVAAGVTLGGGFWGVLVFGCLLPCVSVVAVCCIFCV